MILSDAELQTMIDRGAKAADVSLPRLLFGTLCVQALNNHARMLISREHIRELLADPQNQINASLSIDTLEKLCRQAMQQREL